MIDGLWRVLVKFDHPTGGQGWDVTDKPDAYDECAKLITVLGMGAPWEVVVDGKVHHVRITRAMILGPVNAD